MLAVYRRINSDTVAVTSRSLIHTNDYNSDYLYCFVNTSINNVSCPIRRHKEYIIKEAGSVVLI